MCVRIQHVTRIAIALATATRARAKGEVSFGLRFDEAQLPSHFRNGMDQLKTQLEAFSSYDPGK